MLTPSILTNELSKFIDQESIVFESFPANSIDVANRWSNAFDIYAKQVIPISTTSDAAKTQMYQTLLALNNTPTGASILSAAFLGYVTVLATGMLPLFVATPPPAPLNLTPVFSLGFSGASSEVCLQALTTIVDAWMRTGTATPSTGGSIINWN